MNDEIKEIIKEIECYQNEEVCMIILSHKENKALLDYITNLQQDNEMYAQLKDEYEEEIKDLQQIEQEHKKLNAELRRENSNLKTSLDEAQEVLSEYKEENERLKDNAIHNDKVVDKARWNEMIYKSRCEKASEYIKEHCIDDEFYINLTNKEKSIIEVLNILQNGSDSQ